jgi:hypothetical protein
LINPARYSGLPANQNEFLDGNALARVPFFNSGEASF